MNKGKKNKRSGSGARLLTILWLVPAALCGSTEVQAESYTSQVSCTEDIDCNYNGGGVGVCDNYWIYDEGTDLWWKHGRCREIPCTQSSHCPNEETCSSGMCSSTCSVTGDCSYGAHCNSGRCIFQVLGSASYCWSGGCPEFLGDCDGTSECASGLQCINDIGERYTYSSDTDVCGSSDIVGHWSYCANNSPCSHGQGDCETGECAFGLECKSDRGADFSMDPTIDVCMWPWE